MVGHIRAPARETSFHVTCFVTLDLVSHSTSREDARRINLSPFQPENADATSQISYCIQHRRRNMAWKEVEYEELTKSLTENFNILANEVQFLSDQKTFFEHKLRFAHEQVSSVVVSFLGGQSLATPLHMMRIFSSRSGAALAATTDNLPCILI